MDYEALMAELEAQENEIVLKHFSNEDAWELGTQMVEDAKAQHLAITIEIRRNNQMLFHYAMPGTAKDNDEWLQRKYNLCMKMNHCTYWCNAKMKKQGQTCDEAFNVPRYDYAPNGGCFPVRLEGTGFVGTCAVSGLSQDQDHLFVYNSLKKLMNKQ